MRSRKAPAGSRSAVHFVVSCFMLRLYSVAGCGGTEGNDLYTCANPSVVLFDPTIKCDRDTCRWDLEALDPNAAPVPCRSIEIVEPQFDKLPDLLEPCLWWEMLYGNLGALLPEEFRPKPSIAPSTSPSLTPTIVLSAGPSLTPTMVPSEGPSLIPSIVLSEGPSLIPSIVLSVGPSLQPSVVLSESPSQAPNVLRSESPSASHSESPSEGPSANLVTATNVPTVAPSESALVKGFSGAPSDAPSTLPVVGPSVAPSIANSVVPSMKSAPTRQPTVRPTTTPFISPTSVPTSSPTLSPTASPTRTPTVVPTIPPSSIAFSATEQGDTNEPSRTPIYPVILESLLLTFVFEEGARRLRPSRDLQGTGLLSTLESYDALVSITEEHLLMEMVSLIDADLTFSLVVDAVKAGDSRMETVAVLGTLYFAVNQHSDSFNEEDFTPVAIRKSVEEIFEDTFSVFRYVRALRETGLSTLRDTTLVYPGLLAPTGNPRSPSSSQGEGTPIEDGEEEFWEEIVLNWSNPIWIVIVAGLALGLTGLCLGCCFLCLFRLQRRRFRRSREMAARKLAEADNAATDMRIEGIDADLHKEAAEADNHTSDMSELGYQASEVTSVYSYIDNNTVADDQSYSVAPSFMYPGVDYDEDPGNRSVLWSVMDGIANDLAKARNGTMKTPTSKVDGSPSSMVVTAKRERKANGEVMIFSDEDDELSLVSDRAQPQRFDFGSIMDEPSLPGSGGNSVQSESLLGADQSLIQHFDTICRVDSKATDGNATDTEPKVTEAVPVASVGTKLPALPKPPNHNTRDIPMYQQLEDSSLHSWDRELGIAPSSDSDSSLFMGPDQDLSTNLMALSASNQVLLQPISAPKMQLLRRDDTTPKSGGATNLYEAASETASDNEEDAGTSNYNETGTLSVSTDSSQSDEPRSPAQFVIPNKSRDLSISSSTEKSSNEASAESPSTSSQGDSGSFKSEKENESSLVDNLELESTMEVLDDVFEKVYAQSNTPKSTDPATNRQSQGPLHAQQLV